MFNEELPDHVVYSQPVIDFVTVVAETCIFLENTSEAGRDEFIDKVHVCYSISNFLPNELLVEVLAIEPTNSEFLRSVPF